MHVKIVIEMVKELFMKNINNQAELSKLIDKYLIPQESEKKQNAEVSTPRQLRQDMLDKIPADFWKSPKLVFEPCCGKGGFLIDIIERFMVGLSDLITDDKERYKFIIENCLYFSDINECNIYICKLLIDPNNKYTLNYNLGDTLKLNIKHKWKINGFDAVIGNPPYNSFGGTGGSKKLWDKFVIQSIDCFLNKNGLLCFIHPPNWRKPDNKILAIFKENNLVSLNILTENDGKKFFKCSTKADYYLLQLSKYNNKTCINNNIYIDISNLNYIPNENFDLFNKISGNQDILCSNTSYSSDLKWMKDDKTLENKYILSINSNEIRIKYSNLEKNYINIPKVIISMGRYPYPYNDYKGEYGMSCFNFGIKINSKEEGEQIVKCINSDKFKLLLKNNKWGSYNIEWRMFKYFKPDFYNEFI
jgi:hypothetical protein